MSTVHVRQKLAPASAGSIITTFAFARWALAKLDASPGVNRAAMLAERTLTEMRELQDCGPEAWASRSPDPMLQPLRDLFEIEVLRVFRKARDGDEAALLAALNFAESVLKTALRAGWFDEDILAEAAKEAVG